MMRFFLAGALLVGGAGSAAASSYYCVTATDGWRTSAFDINPADLNETIASIDPMARYLYASCLGAFSSTTRALVLDCAILDDNPSNVLASGQVDDGTEQLIVETSYDGRRQSVTCNKRRPRP